MTATADTWHERRVTGAGVELHVEHTDLTDLADGRTAVVLAHGFTDNGRCWGRFARGLLDRFAVVLVDSRNHGRSGTSPGGTEAQAADLAAVITELHLDRPHLVGHSMGAATAAVLAATHPDLVGRLVLLDPPWTGDGHPDPATARERTERVGAWARHVSGLSDDGIVALGAAEHPDWHPDDLAPWYEAKRQLRLEAGASLELPPWPDTVARIAAPTLLLWGEPERGGIVTPDRAAEVARLNPMVETQQLPGTGHNLQREDLAASLDATRTFLER